MGTGIGLFFALGKLAYVAGARKGNLRDRGKLGAREGDRKHLQPAHCLFRLAPSLICKQRLPVKCQPMKIVLTFRGNPERAKKCRVEYG